MPLVISSHRPACTGPAAPSGAQDESSSEVHWGLPAGQIPDVGALAAAPSPPWLLAPTPLLVLLGDVSSFPPHPLSHTTLHDDWRALGHSLSTGPPLVSLQVSSLPLPKGILSRLACPCQSIPWAPLPVAAPPSSSRRLLENLTANHCSPLIPVPTPPSPVLSVRVLGVGIRMGRF